MSSSEGKHVRGGLISLPEPGARVADKYRIESLVGRGAMGSVYAARHEMLDEKVALKILDPEVAEVPEAAARFVNEARIAARVRSAHVCSILDVGYYEPSIPYIAMEYVEGENLDEILATRSRPPLDEALEIALQALDGVAHAHAHGIVHRDLKPANLMIRPDGAGRFTVKLVDFGVSKAGLRSELTLAGAMLGSPTHMAPEQIRDSSAVDPRADIWGMGVILYELFTGELPFDAEGPAEVLRLVLETEPVRPRALCSNLTHELDAIVMRCLSRDPERRYLTAHELIDALTVAREAIRNAPPESLEDATIVAPLEAPMPITPAMGAPVLSGMAAFPEPFWPVPAPRTPLPPSMASSTPGPISTIPPSGIAASRTVPPARSLKTDLKNGAMACAAVVAAGLIVILAFFATHPAAVQQAVGGAAASQPENVAPSLPEGVAPSVALPAMPPPTPTGVILAGDAGVISPPHPTPSGRTASVTRGAREDRRCPAGLACNPSY